MLCSGDVSQLIARSCLLFLRNTRFTALIGLLLSHRVSLLVQAQAIVQSDYLIICFNLHPRHVKATYICIDFHTFTHGDVVNRFVVLVQQEPPGGSLDVLPRAKTVQSRGAQAPRITFSVLTMRLSGPTRFSRLFFFFFANWWFTYKLFNSCKEINN